MIMIRTIQQGILMSLSSLSLLVLFAAAADGTKPVILKPTYKVRIERAVMIPMRDGKRLSADLIRPDADSTDPLRSNQRDRHSHGALERHDSLG
jgi:predicted acyl esterase